MKYKCDAINPLGIVRVRRCNPYPSFVTVLTILIWLNVSLLCISGILQCRELIRSVRQCKTAAEERNVIAKESAALRNAFQEQDTTYRHRNVAKLMYIHMMGYPTHFGQMETLKLIAASGFPEKACSHQSLTLLFDEHFITLSDCESL